MEPPDGVPMINVEGGDKYPLLCEKYEGRRGRPWQEWSAQWLDLMAGSIEVPIVRRAVTEVLTAVSNVRQVVAQ